MEPITEHLNILTQSIQQSFRCFQLSVRDRQHQCIYLKHFTVFAWQTEPVADYNRTLLLMLLLKLLSLSHCRWLDGLLSMRPTKYRLWRIRIQKDAVNSQLTGSAHYLFPDNSTSWNAGVFPVNTATSSASLGLLLLSSRKKTRAQTGDTRQPPDHAGYQRLQYGGNWIL